MEVGQGILVEPFQKAVQQELRGEVERWRERQRISSGGRRRCRCGEVKMVLLQLMLLFIWGQEGTMWTPTGIRAIFASRARTGDDGLVD
jgi:hypothetical protein